MTTDTTDSATDTTTAETTRIGLLTDLHWTPDDADTIDKLLTEALTHFQDANVDHIIVLGDIIIEGDTSTETRRRFYRLTTDIRERAPAPVTFLRGNHDVTTTDGKAITDLSFEPRNGTIELTDTITGIFLNTSSPQWPDARGELGEDQLRFLDTALSNAENGVVFTHHPLYYHEISEEGHFVEHPEAAFCSDKYRANEIFEDHNNILAAVNGHTHISDHTMYQDVPYFTVNAFNEERPTHTEPNGSFAVLDISPTQVQRTSYQHGHFESTVTITHAETE